jgi:hypothetical protein
MVRLIFKIVVGAFLLSIIVLGAVYYSHPILLKWVTGTAWYVGKPVIATVYTDGRLNNSIKVYHNSKAANGGLPNDYLLVLAEPDRAGMLKYINLNLDEKWIGRPVSTSQKDYDVINGSLYQSEMGSHFADFKDDMKGYNFNPHLYHSGDTIRFAVPPAQLKFNTVLILLK